MYNSHTITPILPFCLAHPGAPWEKGDYWDMAGPVRQAKQNPQIVQNLPLLPSPQGNTPFWSCSVLRLQQ